MNFSDLADASTAARAPVPRTVTAGATPRASAAAEAPPPPLRTDEHAILIGDLEIDREVAACAASEPSRGTWRVMLRRWSEADRSYALIARYRLDAAGEWQPIPRSRGMALDLSELRRVGAALIAAADALGEP